jgi:sarcosine oxidase, subunit beta
MMAARAILVLPAERPQERLPDLDRQLGRIALVDEDLRRQPDCMRAQAVIPQRKLCQHRTCERRDHLHALLLAQQQPLDGPSRLPIPQKAQQPLGREEFPDGAMMEPHRPVDRLIEQRPAQERRDLGMGPPWEHLRRDDLRLRGFTHEELVDRAELKRLVPAIADHCPGGIVSRRDGAADPFRTTQAIRRKAIALGANFIEGVTVKSLARHGSAWRVETTDGNFEAPKIVNAAGAWADRIATQLGEPVPLAVMAPMLMVTAPVPHFIEPVVILRGRRLSFKQLANGTVLIGGGHLGRADRDENRTELDWRKLAESASTVFELFPIMRESTVVRAWAGIEARMPDDIPVIGPSCTSQGVFHQFGFSAHGFQLGPGVGALMAELVTTGATNLPIEPFSVARFSASR